MNPERDSFHWGCCENAT